MARHRTSNQREFQRYNPMRSGGEIGRIKILSLGLDDEMVWAAGIFHRFQWAWEFTDPQASRRGVGQGVYMQGKKHTEARIWYCQSGVCPGPPPQTTLSPCQLRASHLTGSRRPRLNQYWQQPQITSREAGSLLPSPSSSTL